MIISKQQVRLYLRLSISIGILGILFKIMHWPYAWLVLVAGLLGIAIFYSFRFSQKSNRRLLDYAKFFLIIAFLLHYSFRVFHLPYGHVFTLLFQIGFVTFLILHVRAVFFSEETEHESDVEHSTKKSIPAGVSYLLYGIAAIGIIVGAQFKILHWEFGFINGDILLTAGLLAAAVSVFMGSSTSKS